MSLSPLGRNEADEMEMSRWLTFGRDVQAKVHPPRVHPRTGSLVEARDEVEERSRLAFVIVNRLEETGPA